MVIQMQKLGFSSTFFLDFSSRPGKFFIQFFLGFSPDPTWKRGNEGATRRQSGKKSIDCFLWCALNKSSMIQWVHGKGDSEEAYCSSLPFTEEAQWKFWTISVRRRWVDDSNPFNTYHLGPFSSIAANYWLISIPFSNPDKEIYSIPKGWYPFNPNIKSKLMRNTFV